MSRAPVYLSKERQMSIGEIDRQEPRALAGLLPEFFGLLHIGLGHPLTLEIAAAVQGRKMKGESILRIDMELANQAGAISGGPQSRHDVGRIPPIHGEAMGCQTELAILLRVKSREK